MKLIQFKCVSEIDPRILEKYEEIFMRSIDNQSKYFETMQKFGGM